MISNTIMNTIKWLIALSIMYCWSIMADCYNIYKNNSRTIKKNE